MRPSCEALGIDNSKIYIILIMKIPELPSEQQIINSFRSLYKQFQNILFTSLMVFRSPFLIIQENLLKSSSYRKKN